MGKFSSYIFFFYFLTLGFSDLWGGHVHHTDNHGAEKSHLENHSDSNHHHEKSDKVVSQDHCVQHCTVENILTHLLEDKIVSRVDTFDFDNQHEDTTYDYLKPPVSFRSELLFHYSNTIPPPFKSHWNTLTTSPRPPPSLS